jgi:Cu/Ag efflux protein CusF
MNIRTLSVFAVFIVSGLSTLALPAHAQPTGHNMENMPGMSATGSEMMTNAEVRAINMQAHRITLKHGAMNGMPAMTMTYPVKMGIRMPANLKQGDQIHCRVDEIDGVPTVTAVQR